MGVTVIGIVAVTAFSTEMVTTMKQDETVVSGPFTLKFEGLRPNTGPNYTELPGPLCCFGKRRTHSDDHFRKADLYGAPHADD